jgi:hypothetical protein
VKGNGHPLNGKVTFCKQEFCLTRKEEEYGITLGRTASPGTGQGLILRTSSLIDRRTHSRNE